MRMFVTGAHGQVGREAARVFAAHDLYLASHQSDDVTQPGIAETIVRFRPDVVLHAAAMTDVDGCERQPDVASRVNADGTRWVAQGAARAQAYLVVVSTDYVFDGRKGSPYSESDATNPINVYGQTKLAGEQAAKQATDHLSIVRTSWVFGEGKSHFITMVLGRVRQQQVIRAVVDKTGSPTSTKDLVAAIGRLIDRRATGLFHVAGAGMCNWYEYAEAILAASGRAGVLEAIRFEELNRPAARPNSTPLVSEHLPPLGIHMRDWRAMVEEYVVQHES